MIKLALSLAEPYKLISRYDSAINLGPEPKLPPPPERAADENLEAFEARAQAWAAPAREWGKPLRVARQTGDYSAILKPGETPTIFVVRQIPASEWLKLDAAIAKVEAQHADQPETLMRASFYMICRYAVIRVEGAAPPEATMAAAVDPDFPEIGPIQPVAFADLFTGNDRILREIAEVVVERRHTPPN